MQTEHSLREYRTNHARRVDWGVAVGSLGLGYRVSQQHRGSIQYQTHPLSGNLNWAEVFYSLFYYFMSLRSPSTSRDNIIEETITKVNGETAVKRYRKGEFLGKGGFAKCYTAVSIQTSKVSAVKIVDKASLTKNRAKQKLLSQIRIHKSLHHPNVVQFQNCFEDSSSVYIFLELCSNKTLSEYLKAKKRLSPSETKSFMHQLLSAVKYIHSNRIIHRDLKMGNIFLAKNYEVKVGDFGLATKLEFNEERKRTICGTPNYIAPEIIQGTVGHSYEVDAWSCGVICFALLFGRPPFETNQIKSTYAKIKSGKYQFPDNSIPEEGKDFIRRILQLDPRKRLTIPEMLQHPFMSNVELLKGPVSQVQNLNKITVLDFYRSQEDFAGLMNSPRQNPVPRLTTSRSSTNVTLLKHVDYSSKYGLGYILSNGNYGVYFNDSSKILLNPSTNDLVFIPAKCDDQLSFVRAKANNLPANNRDLSKKYFLLEHFKCYLDAQLGEKIVFPSSEKSQLIYVKQWLKTKHAIMFRLNNKVFQVDFLDESQLILNAQSKTIVFRNKKGQEKRLSLAEALSSSENELSRRIRYTKDILNSLRRSAEEEASGTQLL